MLYIKAWWIKYALRNVLLPNWFFYQRKWPTVWLLAEKHKGTQCPNLNCSEPKPEGRDQVLYIRYYPVIGSGTLICWTTICTFKTTITKVISHFDTLAHDKNTKDCLILIYQKTVRKEGTLNIEQVWFSNRSWGSKIWDKIQDRQKEDVWNFALPSYTAVHLSCRL